MLKNIKLFSLESSAVSFPFGGDGKLSIEVAGAGQQEKLESEFERIKDYCWDAEWKHQLRHRQNEILKNIVRLLIEQDLQVLTIELEQRKDDGSKWGWMIYFLEDKGESAGHVSRTV